MRWMLATITDHEVITVAAITSAGLVVVAIINNWVQLRNGRKTLDDHSALLAKMDDTLNRHHDGAPTLGEFLSRADERERQFQHFRIELRQAISRDDGRFVRLERDLATLRDRVDAFHDGGQP